MKDIRGTEHKEKRRHTMRKGGFLWKKTITGWVTVFEGDTLTLKRDDWKFAKHYIVVRTFRSGVNAGIRSTAGAGDTMERAIVDATTTYACSHCDSKIHTSRDLSGALHSHCSQSKIGSPSYLYLAWSFERDGDWKEVADVTPYDFEVEPQQ